MCATRTSTWSRSRCTKASARRVCRLRRKPLYTKEASMAGSTLDPDSTSDSRGTGEHLTAGKDPRVRPNEDRGVDRVVGPGEAGLGRGLDEAEKARVDPVKKPKR